MKKIFSLLLILSSVIGISSCSNKRAIPVGDVDAKGKLDYLTTRCKDDNQLVARLLNMDYSHLDSLKFGKIQLTDSEEQRLNDVYSYTMSKGVSMPKLKAKYDTGLKWYDHILFWPVTHPWWFWGITIFLFIFFVLNRMDAATDAIVTSPYTISGIGGFLSRLFFLIKNGFTLEILLYIVIVILHFSL